MHNTSALTVTRIDRFLAERLAPAMYRRLSPLTVAAWEVPDEPVPFDTAHGQEFTPITPGTRWGRPWGTTWFHLAGAVPADWQAEDQVELVVDLGYSADQPGFQTEGAVYDPDGRIIKSVHPRNRFVPVQVGPGGSVEFYVEAASNPQISSDFGFLPTPMGSKRTAGSDLQYRLGRIELGVVDQEVYELVRDVEVLRELMGELPEQSSRRAEILHALDRMVDVMNPNDVHATATAGRAAIAAVLASPAHASAHTTVAVGHAHIDSAWLWPVRETHRKCARTFSNVLDLMDRDPDFVFAASSAQQYAWVKEDQPELFERIKARVAEGRFIPVGGMWVESDTNMPGSEAMARQFVAGQKFFADEFGIISDGAWLPDSFGYSAALPQIVRASGGEWFVTQKISWNETNTFPHHTFDWEGIDGSRVVTHFPPADTYNAEITGEELALTERRFAEKGSSNTSLTLFGYGDGGGGPTREMLSRIERAGDLEGSTRVELGTPSSFFARVADEYPTRPIWTGEMYLEFHRGTLTSQAKTKQGNRRSEHLLREAELWAATDAVRNGSAYPYEQLATMWHTVLLQQFHDILPGTCIAWVYEVAEENYRQIFAETAEIIATATGALAGDGDVPLVFNAGPFDRSGAPALGAAPAQRSVATASATKAADGIVLENDLVRVVVDDRGVLASVFDKRAGRETVPAGTAGAELQLFRDNPNKWDAWDIDEVYRRSQESLTSPVAIELIELADGPATVRVRHEVGESSITVEYSLAPDAARVDLQIDADWHERERLLKLAFPIDVHTDSAISEIQFGHVDRPTHVNTSWDKARFETVAHRWVQVGEPGFGAAVANDSTYGHDITRTPAEGGGTYSTVRLSLLRAPLFPDPDADQGEHTLRCSLVVGAGVPEAIEEGYRINLPERVVTGAEPVAPLVTVANPAVVVEAVKLAEDRSGDVIVRLYESLGGRANTEIAFGFDVAEAVRVDLLERPTGEELTSVDGGCALSLRPFEITTLRLARS